MGRRAEVVGNTLQTTHRWRRSVLDRVSVLMRTPRTTFLALLLELFLRLGICKAKIQFDPINVGCDTVEILDDSLSNLTAFKARHVRNWYSSGAE